MRYLGFTVLLNCLMIGLLYAIPVNYATARIDVESADRANELVPGEASAGAKVQNFDWLSNGRWGVYANFPFGARETEGRFTFTSKLGSAGSIIVRGPYYKDGGKLFAFPVEFMSVSVNGQELLSRPVTVTHENSLKFPCQWEADKPVTIAVRYQMAEKYLDNPESLPLDLRNSVNMGLRDPVAGDGRGGWTDQGAERDLSLLIPGARKLDGANFTIADPAANGGKSMLTFASSNISPAITLKKATLPVAENAGFTHLYLLHAAGYGAGKAQLGVIRVYFTDGTQKELPVTLGTDLGDWWRPAALPNAVVAERFKYPDAVGGYYFSQFRLSDERKPVAKVELESLGGEPVWLVLAASLGNRALDSKKIEAKTPVYIVKESPEWRKFAETDLTVKPNTILDFSDLCAFRPITDKERVTVADGHFVRNGERIRFTGCSSTESLGEYDKKEIEEYAKLIRRQGYNFYRPHFLDFFLMANAKGDFIFDPVSLDQFDYLVSCLKKEGVYLYLDAMSGWSGFLKGSDWDWQKKGLPNYKNLLFADETARANWKIGIDKFLHHVNPYTGTKLVDDPVLIAVLPVNEQELSTPLEVPEIRQKWETFVGKPGLPFPDLKENTPEAAAGRRFMAELYRNTDDYYRQTLREIGYTGPLSMYDCTLSPRTALARKNSEVISMHNYQSHPKNWIKPGSTLQMESTIKNHFRVLDTMFAQQQPGKPFLTTEFLHCFWDKYRFEQGLSEGALSSFQDVDGIMNHQLPVVLKRPETPIKTFRIYQDPVARASEVVSNAVFMNQAAKPAAARLAFAFDPETILATPYAEKKFLEPQRDLALQARVGITFDPAAAQKAGWTVIKADESLEYKTAADFRLPAPETFFRLDDKNGTFTVVLPQIEGIAALEKGEYRLHELQIRNSGPGAFTLISRDGCPLNRSQKMLLVVATDALNQNMRFDGDDRYTLQELGDPVVLLRTVKLELELRHDNDPQTTFKLYAVRQNGDRAEELPVVRDGGKLKFSVDTAALKSGPVLFFELIAGPL